MSWFDALFGHVKKPVGWKPAWRLAVLRHVDYARSLEGDLKRAFEEQVPQFIAQKEFIGGGGLVISETMKAVVAAHAVRLTLGLDLSYYSRLSEVVIHPDAFIRPARPRPIDPFGIQALHGGVDILNGEALSWGTVVLSWADLVESGSLALHEFAHVLDRKDGGFDGTPPLHSRDDYARWKEVMSRHYLRLRDGLEPELRLLGDYGAENEAEFFSVATEAFFEASREMRDGLPALHALLRDFYRQDPAAVQTGL